MTIPMQWALRRRMMMAALGSGVDVAALSITYTGAHTDYGMVTMSDGARYRLLAFTSSGTLSIEQPVNCEVCVVGGGANGNDFNGGAGAYLKNQVIEAFEGGAVVVGAAQGASSFNTVAVAAVSGRSGGTGGGAGSTTYNSPGTGDGLSKYPFGDTGFSLWSGKPHCAGGGAGGDHEYRYDADDEQYKVCYDGGNGGTNGSSGGKGTRRDYVIGPGGDSGSGGTYGGGQGGHDGDASTPGSGGNATYYGSGGGGYGGGNSLMGDAIVGSGYQGIVYMRIPGEPAYISDLPLGALINIGTDGGLGAANYEIADINNFVSGGVVLVRKNIHSKSEFGSSTYYPGSTLDNTMTSIYNSLPEKLQSKIMDATFALLSSGSITRKVFALTYTMAGFGENYNTAEGKALQLYTSNENRIKKYNGSADSWWLSSPKVPYSYLVSTDGTASYHGRPNSHGVVPAFVIPSKTPYNATPNTDGSYNLILCGAGSANIAKLEPTPGKSYVNGVSGLSAAQLHEFAHLISNNANITNSTTTVYVDCDGEYRKVDIGNQITISLNGTNYVFDVIGFNHDDLTSAVAYGSITATGKAGITFQMHDLFATLYAMNSSNKNSGGWKSSAMRTSTMATMKGYLPDDWEAIIKPVNKASGTGGGSSSGTETVSDSCFLLAEIEIFGSTSHSVSGEGTQYAYYKAGNSKVKNKSGSADSWWERSPYSGNSGPFCRVSRNGNANYLGADVSYGVAFGFCV